MVNERKGIFCSAEEIRVADEGDDAKYVRFENFGGFFDLEWSNIVESGEFLPNGTDDFEGYNLVGFCSVGGSSFACSVHVRC